MTEGLYPARFWERLEDGRVHCYLCHQHCTIREGGWGVCGVRTVEDGDLQTAVYGKAIALNADPIEKKPLFHFYPGTRSLSLATVGCNFRCTFCQNWNISQVRRTIDRRTPVPPEDVVHIAEEERCRTIAFTYTEPTIFMEYAQDTAEIARQRGIETVFVTNGFMTREALEAIAPNLGAANVDLKSFDPSVYKKIMGGKLEPVLDNLRVMRGLGIWVEVTTLVVPDMNDSEDELRAMAHFIAEEVGVDTPWHVSRFHPDYDMTDRGATPIAKLKLARDLGREAGLRYVYTGNIPGDEGESTFCHECGEKLIGRWGFRVTSNEVVGGACPTCGTPVSGVGL